VLVLRACKLIKFQPQKKARIAAGFFLNA